MARTADKARRKTTKNVQDVVEKVTKEKTKKNKPVNSKMAKEKSEKTLGVRHRKPVSEAASSSSSSRKQAAPQKLVRKKRMRATEFDSDAVDDLQVPEVQQPTPLVLEELEAGTFTFLIDFYFHFLWFFRGFFATAG